MFNIFKRLFGKPSGRKFGKAAYNTISGDDLPNDNESQPKNGKTWPKEFPWSDVKSCLKDKLDNMKFKGNHNCQKCGRHSEDLVWIKFSSPRWTWENLCGREGPLSICPNCRIQVEFLCDIMN